MSETTPGRTPRVKKRTYSVLGWLWESTPGPLWLRILLVLALCAALVLLLFNYGFPYAVVHVPFIRDWVVGASGTVDGG